MTTIQRVREILRSYMYPGSDLLLDVQDAAPGYYVDAYKFINGEFRSCTSTTHLQQNATEDQFHEIARHLQAMDMRGELTPEPVEREVIPPLAQRVAMTTIMPFKDRFMLALRYTNGQTEKLDLTKPLEKVMKQSRQYERIMEVINDGE